MINTVEHDLNRGLTQPTQPVEKGAAYQGLRIMDINPMRVDLASHCEMSAVVREERQKSPGIRILTDADRVAKIVGELKATPCKTAVNNHENHDDEQNHSDPVAAAKKRKWDIAVSKVVTIVGRLRQKGEHEEANRHLIDLFDGLRDPDRRERTMERVEVIYESTVSGFKGK